MKNNFSLIKYNLIEICRHFFKNNDNDVYMLSRSKTFDQCKQYSFIACNFDNIDNSFQTHEIFVYTQKRSFSSLFKKYFIKAQSGRRDIETKNSDIRFVLSTIFNIELTTGSMTNFNFGDYIYHNFKAYYGNEQKGFYRKSSFIKYLKNILLNNYELFFTKILLEYPEFTDIGIFLE